MKRLVSSLLLLGLAATLAAPAMAQEGKKKKKKRPRFRIRVVNLPKSVTDTLTEEQKKKFGELNREYGPKFFAIFRKNFQLLTDEQRKAQRKAVTEAREAGKKRAEIAKAAREAVKFTDEQKKKRAANQKEMAALRAEATKKVLKLLTDEQKKLYEEARKRAKKKKRPQKKDTVK